jgi:hypothetical protein
MLVVSFGLTGGGVALLIADETARDDAGFLMSDREHVASDTYAVATGNLEVHANGPADVLPDALLGDIKVSVSSDTPVFVGIAATEDVEQYLSAVRHETVVDLTMLPDYLLSEGGAPTSAPATRDFWAAQSSGAGDQSLRFELENGDWTVVLMNTDATAGIDADVAAGAEVPALEWLVPLLLAVGGTGLLVSSAALLLLVRGASRR